MVVQTPGWCLSASGQDLAVRTPTVYASTGTEDGLNKLNVSNIVYWWHIFIQYGLTEGIQRRKDVVISTYAFGHFGHTLAFRSEQQLVAHRRYPCIVLLSAMES